MSSNLQYLKGVRTRFYNTLEKEIQSGSDLLNTDVIDLPVYECRALQKQVGETRLKINTYIEKLSNQSDKLAQAIGDTDDTFTETIIEDDSTLSEKALDMCCKRQSFEEQLKAIEEDESKRVKEESAILKPTLSEELQKVFEFQMKLQQEILDKQNKKDAQVSAVKLPKLEITSFNGNKLYWIEFWDSFESAVHKKESLSGIDKFNYLKSKLTGEARIAIAGLSLSNENYEVAVRTLHERFGDRQEAIDLHYKSLLDIVPARNSTESLRHFLDKSEKHIRSLEVLKQDTNQEVFVSMIRRKLPSDILIQLEIMKGADSKWSVCKLRDLLRQYIVAKEKAEKTDAMTRKPVYKGAAYQASKPTYGFKNYNRHINQGASSGALFSSEKQIVMKREKASANCRYCGKSHWSDECPKYTSIEDRKRRIRGSCYRCLKEGHLSNECKSSKTCVYCGVMNAHHRSLCEKKFKRNNQKESANLSEELEVSRNTDTEKVPEEVGLLSYDQIVLMQTAQTDVKEPNGERSEEIRLLLDSGSHRTYITEALANRLGLKEKEEQEIQLVTFGSAKSKVIKTRSTELSLKLKNGQYMAVTANIVPNITGTITRKPVKLQSPMKFKDLTRNLSLADTIPKESETLSLDLLVGNDYYLDIIRCDKIEVQPGLYLLSSNLGWILSGRTNTCATDVKSRETNMLILTYGNGATETSLFTSVDDILPTKPNLEDFWNIEAIGITDRVDQSEDESAMEIFKETLKCENARYQVTWPWKDELPDLPENRGLAKGRLKSLVNKLEKHPDLMKKYNEIFQDQLRDGMIEKVERTNSDGLKHYLPHHVVIKPEKTRTKLRIVYDASAKTRKEYKSLNECLKRGPVMLHNLCGIIMRFRLHKIGMVSDIEKAFLQIGLQPSQRDVTRFLWLKDCETPVVDETQIQEYRFCRVPFGIVSSPFLLGATIDCHLDTYNSKWAEQLKENIYMDNVITGVESVDEAVDMYKSAKCIFNEGKMNLREWMTNSDDVRSVIATEDKAIGDTTKVLGHLWDSRNDTLALNDASILKEDLRLTKRNVLKQVASVFDPLGLFSPVTMRGKVLLQRTWSKQKDWDDVLDSEDSKEWIEIKSDLEQIQSVKLPRSVCTPDDTSDIKYSLVCFTDASNKAYAASVYLIQTTGVASKSDLMFAKTRLAPVKGMTIPRLELMAVLIGVRVLKFAEKQIKLPLEHVVLMTDSQCVLHWISSEKQLPVFVNNRVKEIRSHDNIDFRYVNTKDNSADIASRGCALQILSEDQTWWHGPEWLCAHIHDWQQFKILHRAETESKLKIKVKDPLTDKQTTALKIQEAGDGLINNGEYKMQISDISKEDCLVVIDNCEHAENAPFEIDTSRFSSATKLVRVTAWCFRFVRKLKGQKYDSNTLTSEALDEAEYLWLKHIQMKHFKEVYTSIASKFPNNLAKQLDIFVDEHGILRCRGRLEHANLSEAARYPILLPRKDRFTHLLVERVHKRMLHCGVSQTLSEIRQRFWIPHGRATIRTILKLCTVCKRIDGGPYKLPQMAPLPKERVSQSTPFSYVGLDYLGPMYIKENKESKKVWVCLYTCLVTRAVHLEIVQDMSASAFLLCLRRFIATRGTPKEIISDNAKQFKLSSETVKLVWAKLLQDDDIQNYASNEGIKWTFIIELAPWMGGFYERLVGIVKRALRKSIGRKLLLADQMYTLLKEVEAVVNSRPLVYVGEDINSSITITPNHFTCLNPKTGIPENECTNDDPEFKPYESTAERLLQIWKKGEQLLNKFWILWRDEYLLSLRERSQSKIKSSRIQSHESPSVGDIVIIRDNVPRGQWKFGKLTELRFSKDGKIRSAQLETPSGQILRRPLNLLFPIELSGSKVSESVIKKGKQSVVKVCETSAPRPKRKAAENARKLFENMM